jgi:hypothetical protein
MLKGEKCPNERKTTHSQSFEKDQAIAFRALRAGRAHGAPEGESACLA